MHKKTAALSAAFDKSDKDRALFSARPPGKTIRRLHKAVDKQKRLYYCYNTIGKARERRAEKEGVFLKKLRNLTAALLAAVLLVCTLPAALAAQPGYATRGAVADRLLAAAAEYHPGLRRSDILRGYANGDLDEDGRVTRAQALVMLERAFGDLPTPVGDNARSGYSASNFTDVPAWAASELRDVFSAGIVAGTTATTFSPNAYVTDHQMELFIDRVYALEGTDRKDDFYAAVNKTALDKSVIQPGTLGSGAFNDLTSEVNSQVADLIRQAASAPKTAGEKKISALYGNILDMTARNRAGSTPIAAYVKALDAASTLEELMAVHADVYRQLCASLLLGFGLTADAKNSNVYDLTFDTFSPALGQGGYAGASAGQKSAYLAYIQTLDLLLGETQTQAARDAQLIWAADSALAAASLTNQELGDVDKTYNLYTMAQLQSLFPHVDLSALFAQTGLTQTDKIVVSDVGALKAAAALFDPAHLETLKAYCRLALAAGFGPMLSQPFIDAASTFSQAYLGMSGAASMEDTAAQYVQSLMSDYLGQAYVSRYFSAKAKTDVEQMVRDILAVYKERINSLTWMSGATKTKAVRKLDTMELKIGYPDQWDDTLADTPILSAGEGGSFFANVLAIARASQEQLPQLQQEGVDKEAWAMTPYTVNAYYDPTANSINFPAGILQSPFYDEAASYEKNLGSIGYVIAHEITHAFDNNGAKYDETGNAADWWTPSDYDAFQALCQKVVALYDGRESAPGIRCNGALTLSENIADLGSAACITELESRRSAPDYQALYTAMAQIWCSSYSRETRLYLAQADVHAPDKLRGSLVLQQFQPFYDAFGIAEGDGMWLAPADRVSIW
jgi:putative endopeptidase